MATTIDRDLGGFNSYKVTIRESGFGRIGPIVGLSLDDALEAVRHYYRSPQHNEAVCPICRKDAKR